MTGVDLEIGGRRGLAEDVARDARVEALVRGLHVTDDVDVGVAGGRGSLEMKCMEL